MSRMRLVPRFGARLPLFLSVVGLILLDGVESFADRIVLRGGGQIQGKVLDDPNRSDRVTVLLLSGKTPLTFQKPQILQVTPEPSPLDEYVVRREKAGEGAEAQHELGLWCEAHKLADLAEVHYEAALKQDKAFAPAHQKLGHTLVAGRWLNADELREAQGLVLYKGKWITKEERTAREADLAAGAEHASWVRRIRLLRRALSNSTEERALEAERQLRAIRDPVAVNPLVRVLGQDEAPFRILLDQILLMIPGPEAARALVVRLLSEPDSEVREGTMAGLEQRPEETIVPSLVKALRSTNPAVVNRAAWALSTLGATAAVPRLVPALITTQYRTEMIPADRDDSPPSVLGSIGVPIATNGSSVAFMTPPAVGPGSVGFGATSLPATPNLISSLSVGGGPATGPANRGPLFRLVSYSYRNVEVHDALVGMTGQDFGYDIASWKRWVDRSFRVAPAPLRQVPQP